MLSLKYKNLIRDKLFEYRTRGVTKVIVKRNLTFKTNKLNELLRLYNLSDFNNVFYKKIDNGINFIIPVSETQYDDSKAENSYYIHRNKEANSFYIDPNIKKYDDYTNKITEKCFTYLSIDIEYLEDDMVCSWYKDKYNRYAIILKNNNITLKDFLDSSYKELTSPQQITEVFNNFFKEELVPLEQPEKISKKVKNNEITPLSQEDIEKVKNYKVEEYFNNYVKFSDLEQEDLKDQYRHGSSLALYNIEENKNPGTLKNIKMRPNDNAVRLQPEAFFNINQFNKIDNVQIIGQKSCDILKNKEYDTTPHETDETIALGILKQEFEISHSANPSTIVDVDGIITSSKYGKDEDVEYSEHNVKLMLNTWSTEMLCPLALLSLAPSSTKSINWGKKTISGKEVSSRDILINLFDPNHTGTFNNALIAYPQSGELLYDSKIAVPTDNGKHKMIYISSKGGLKSTGAAASMKGLYDKLVYPELFNDKNQPFTDWEDSEGIINFIKNNEAINPLIKADFIDNGKYINELGIIYVFSSPLIATEYGHKFIIESLIASKTKNWLGIDFSTINYYETFTNYLTNSRVGKAIISLLDYQKFDFAQMDVTTKLKNGSFQYTYAVQYPAIFKGIVNFEWNQKKNLIKFHILGD